MTTQQNEITGTPFRGLRDIFTKKRKKGTARIIPFTADRFGVFQTNLHAMRVGLPVLRITEGDYVKLTIDDKIVMSDTPMELRTNISFVTRANGSVLIAGLGLGLIIRPILLKGNVCSITVIEKNKDVIDIVHPYFKNTKLKVIHDDIERWRPKDGVLYDSIYFDIWPDVSTTNLKSIRKLERQFSRFLNKQNESSFIDSWMKRELFHLKRIEQNEERAYRRYTKQRQSANGNTKADS